MSLIPTAADKEHAAKLLEKLNLKSKRWRFCFDQFAEIDAQVHSTQLNYAGAHNRCSLILRLPVELISLILQEAVEASVLATDDVDRDVGRQMERRCIAACKLSHICQTLRSIALSLPNLWTTVVTYGSLSGPEHLNTYFERSRNQPLDLYFKINTREFDFTWEAVVKKAVDQISRWRCFILHFSSTPLYHFDRPLMSDVFHDQLSAPNLEVFEVLLDSSLDKDSMSPLPSRPYFGGGAPKLQQASFDSWSLMAFQPLWNVTTLQMANSQMSPAKYPFTTFLNILMSPRLENLSLSGDMFRPPTIGEKLIVAPSLKNFRLLDCNILASHIFKYFRGPKLEYLVLNLIDVQGDWAFPSAIDSTQNPGNLDWFPALRSLAVINCDVDFDCGYRLASLTNNVTELYVSHDENCCSVDEDLISTMTDAAAGKVFWPQLTSLYSNVDDLAGDVNEHCKRCLELITDRWTNLQRRCVLYLQDSDAEFLLETHPETWRQLTDEGSLGQWKIKDLDWVPWPARKTQTFESIWEDKFYTWFVNV